MSKNIRLQDGKMAISTIDVDNSVKPLLDIDGSIVTPSITFSGDLDVTGRAIIHGDLVVNGVTTTINTETLNLADNIITLNSDAVGDPDISPVENAGIEVNRGTAPLVGIYWNETLDQWELSDGGPTNYKLLTTFDVDTGNMSDYARKSINETITGSWTFNSEFFNVNGIADSYINFLSNGVKIFEFGQRGSVITMQNSNDNYLSIDTALLTMSTDTSVLQATSSFSLLSSGDLLLSGDESEGYVFIGSNPATQITYDLTDPVVAKMFLSSPLLIESENETYIKSTFTRFVDRDSTVNGASTGTIQVQSIYATNDLALTIRSGDALSDTGDGQHLYISGGAPGATSGTPGSVIVGSTPGSSEIHSEGDLHLSSENGEIILGPASNGVTPTNTIIRGDFEQDLTLSGGDSTTTAAGGNLILKGGNSALGIPGSVVVDSNTTINGSLTVTGAISVPSHYPLPFFILNNSSTSNSIVGAFAVTRSVQIQLAGHYAWADSPPTPIASTHIIQRVRAGASVQIGTIVFSSGSNYGTVTITNNDTLQPGDIVKIITSATSNSAIAGITVTLNGIAS